MGFWSENWDIIIRSLVLVKSKSNSLYKVININNVQNIFVLNYKDSNSINQTPGTKKGGTPTLLQKQTNCETGSGSKNSLAFSSLYSLL